jgi:hypothetical protein
MKDHKFYPGSYYATINWGANDLNTDLSLAEDALEHNTEVVEEYLSTFKYLSANKTIKNIINQFKSPQIN